MMRMLSRDELARYVVRQLAYFSAEDRPTAVTKQFAEATDIALGRAQHCFERVSAFSRYIVGSVCDFRFYHLHADMYATFLCYLQNSLYENFGNAEMCDRLMQLNHMLHGFMLSYGCTLPKVIFLCHPVGTVLGNAQYSDYLSVVQNVTVSTNAIIGAGVYLTAGSIVLPGVRVGDRCLINNNAVVRKDVPPDSCLFVDGESGGQRRTAYDMAYVLTSHFIEKYLLDDGLINA